MSKKSPNREEQFVMHSLISQGYTDLIFETDGNLPPDILLNKNIAIEVRRLNQNIEINGCFEGLEQLDFSIHGMIRKIMNSFTFIPNTNGAFLIYKFKRPLPPLKELRKGITNILTKHLLDINQNKHYSIGENFELEIFPASNKLENIYMHGSNSDADSGGFVLELLHENLNLIIREKENKINKHKSKYHEWWLALLDNLLIVWDDQTFKQFNSLPRHYSSFNRILLVSASTPTQWKYLYE